MIWEKFNYQSTQPRKSSAYLKWSTTCASKLSCEVSCSGKATSHMGHVLAAWAEVADSVREDIDIPGGGEEERGAA